MIIKGDSKWEGGNLSFTTINLPRLGIKNRGNIGGFYRDLDDIINITMEQLIERFEIQANKKARNFPFLMGARYMD